MVAWLGARSSFDERLPTLLSSARRGERLEFKVRRLRPPRAARRHVWPKVRSRSSRRRTAGWISETETVLRRRREAHHDCACCSPSSAQVRGDAIGSPAQAPPQIASMMASYVDLWSRGDVACIVDEAYSAFTIICATARPPSRTSRPSPSSRQTPSSSCERAATPLHAERLRSLPRPRRHRGGRDGIHPAARGRQRWGARAHGDVRAAADAVGVRIAGLVPPPKWPDSDASMRRAANSIAAEHAPGEERDVAHHVGVADPSVVGRRLFSAAQLRMGEASKVVGQTAHRAEVCSAIQGCCCDLTLEALGTVRRPANAEGIDSPSCQPLIRANEDPPHPALLPRQPRSAPNNAPWSGVVDELIRAPRCARCATRTSSTTWTFGRSTSPTATDVNDVGYTIAELKTTFGAGHALFTDITHEDATHDHALQQRRGLHQLLVRLERNRAQHLRAAQDQGLRVVP